MSQVILASFARLPTMQTARAALTLAIGHDGWQLLAAVDHPDAPPWLREVPAVAIMRRVWMQNYWWDGTQLRWREADNIPPGGTVRQLTLRRRRSLRPSHMAKASFTLVGN